MADSSIPDVSDRFNEAASEPFREADFFRSLLNHTSDGILTIDTDSTIIYANPAIHDIFGYHPQELIGDSLLTLIPPDLHDQHLDAINQYLQTGDRSFNWDGIELPGRHKNGHTITLEIAFQEYDHAGTKLFTGVIRDITEQNAREQELERYETLVETADDGIYQLDPTGHFVAVNDIVTEVTGYSREQLIGEHASLVLDDADLAKCMEVIHTQLTTGERGDQPLELDIQTADGGVVSGELRLNVLMRDGEFHGTVGIVRDITARKRDEAERQLLHSTTRSIAEAETTVDGLQAVISEVCELTEWAYGEAWVPNDDGTQLERTSAAYTVSDAFDQFKERSRVTAFGPNEGLPGRVWATKDPEWMPNVSAVSAEVFPRVDTAAEVGVKAALGVPVTADERVVAVLAFYMAEEKARDNRLVDIVSTVATNLGTLVERKQQEDALRQHRQELARERDDLQSELEEIYDRVTDAFFGLNTEWEFTYVNSQAEAVLEQRAEELVGTSIWEAFPDIRDSTFQAKYEEAMETQSPVVFEEYYEPLDAWFEVRAYPSETGLSVYFRDVTERKHREHALKRQNKRLESFASMLAHELRNPLNIAQIYASQAVDGEAADHLEAALDRMEDMIDILLVTARGSDSVIDWKPIRLTEIATEVWEDVAANESDTDLVCDGERTVHADRTHLQHLFLNLFENAIEHGGTDVTVRVGTLADGFYVEDDGPGISETDQDAVFAPGHTTEDTGIGLGLTFVAQLAETYGWDYTLTESDAGGTRFEFRQIDQETTT